jgi:hypothetical protein
MRRDTYDEPMGSDDFSPVYTGFSLMVYKAGKTNRVNKHHENKAIIKRRFYFNRLFHLHSKPGQPVHLGNLCRSGISHVMTRFSGG